MTKKCTEKVTGPESVINTIDKAVNTVLPMLRLNQAARRVISSKSKTSPGMLNAINFCCAIKNIISAVKRNNRIKKQKIEKQATDVES